MAVGTAVPITESSYLTLLENSSRIFTDHTDFLDLSAEKFSTLGCILLLMSIWTSLRLNFNPYILVMTLPAI